MGRFTLLAVFAHPDDECFRSGGTLALLAQSGVRVQVLTATRGEAGSCGDPPVCRPAELPSVREGELRCACSALGIEPPIQLDYHDGALAAVDEQEGASRLLAVIRACQPQVLLTWPADGLSGHPDHMAVSRWVTLAFEQAAAGQPETSMALYHLAVPRSVADGLGMAHLSALPDEEVDLAVDIAPVWHQKLAAIRCHRTQAQSSPILSAPEPKQRLFLAREHFRLATARAGYDFFRPALREWSANQP